MTGFNICIRRYLYSLRYQCADKTWHVRSGRNTLIPNSRKVSKSYATFPVLSIIKNNGLDATSENAALIVTFSRRWGDKILDQLWGAVYPQEVIETLPGRFFHGHPRNGLYSFGIKMKSF
jgi:hypothetical protein